MKTELLFVSFYKAKAAAAGAAFSSVRRADQEPTATKISIVIKTKTRN